MSEADYRSIRKLVISVVVAVLTGIAGQTGALLWWGGGIDARMNHAEYWLNDLSERVHTLETDR